MSSHTDSTFERSHAILRPQSLGTTVSNSLREATGRIPKRRHGSGPWCFPPKPQNSPSAHVTIIAYPGLHSSILFLPRGMGLSLPIRDWVSSLMSAAADEWNEDNEENEKRVRRGRRCSWLEARKGRVWLVMRLRSPVEVVGKKEQSRWTSWKEAC